MKYVQQYLLAIATLTGLGMTFTSVAMTDIGQPGELHFTITIKQPTCELVDENIEVNLGTMYLGKGLKAGDILSEKAFAIKLDDCGDVVRAYVKMDGDADKDDNSLFALSGGATGVALKIVDNSGTQQLPVSSGGGDGMLWSLTPGQPNQLDYVASYILTSSAQKAGDTEALVNLSITYE